MVEVKNKHFNLAQICESGQCFRMKELEDNKFQIISGDRYLIAEQKSDDTVILFTTQTEYEGYWKHYFDLDTDYSRYIAATDPCDEYLIEAVRFGNGIRILNQDLWEMIVSFLISQQNNIARIRRCIENISQKYGKECKNEFGETYYAFPTPNELALSDENALMECNLGYRSKYVVRAANMFAKGQLSLTLYQNISYAEAKQALMEIYGVGKKVADCICLFSLHHIEAFPIDTHINQVLNKYYANGFPFERYDGFAGVMQQYIFYYELNA